MKLIKQFNLNLNYPKINKIYLDLLKKLKHHTENNYIISSFDEHGNIKKIGDSSVIMAFCHCEFDNDIISVVI